MVLSDRIHIRFNKDCQYGGIVLLMILISCNPGIEQKNIKTDVPSAGNSAVLAERFSINRLDSITRLTIINPWQGAANVSQVFYLVKRNSGGPPPGSDPSQVIYVPLKSIICTSTTHVAMITALGEEATISGVSGAGLIYSDKLSPGIDEGLVKDIGYEAGLNKELIVKLSPDLLMMYGIGSESAGYPGKIGEMGIKIMFNADYLETDPLGKAEWIKVFGALYCKENEADSIFNAELHNYNEIKSAVQRYTADRPKVMLGLPFRDTWYISPGNSFISKLIKDAGGEYIWQNTYSDISMPCGIENVYLNAVNADFWLNIGTVTSGKEITLVDKRLAGLPCFRKGNLYNNNKRITAKGGNDYWESGAVFPHTILKDIASILHPGLFSGTDLVYYRKIY